jgi:hypothetical protein
VRRARWQAFREAYVDHLAVEEGGAFDVLDLPPGDAERQGVGDEMAGRRGAHR